jgi:death-on-curing protein
LRSEPHWLPLDVIIDVNQDAVSQTSESFFLRDPGLLESACARPQHRWHYGEDDVVALAVTLLLGISQNHPFEQGNKWTAFTAAVMFLANGYEFDRDDGEDLGEFIEAAVRGDVPEKDFVEYFRAAVRPLG